MRIGGGTLVNARCATRVNIDWEHLFGNLKISTPTEIPQWSPLQPRKPVTPKEKGWQTNPSKLIVFPVCSPLKDGPLEIDWLFSPIVLPIETGGPTGDKKDARIF